MTPGHAQICAGCVRRGADASHPNNCLSVRWIGDKHHKPAVQADRCSDFEPVDRPAEGLVHEEIASR